MMSPKQLAELAGCNRMTVIRALRKKKIPGAKFVEIGLAAYWQIPDEAGKEWAKEYVPYAALKEERPYRRKKGAPLA